MKLFKPSGRRSLPVGFALVSVLGCLLASGCGSGNEAELVKLRQENQELIAATQELEKLRNENQEVQRLRKENQEIHKLRADFQQYQKLQKDFQMLQGQSLQLSNTIQQQQQVARQNATLQNQNQQLQGALAQNRDAAAANACIQNMRLLEGTKEQWAIENKKVRGSIPTPENLKPYLMNNQLPVCPGGGIYTINPVGVPPTCSINGHRLN
jgi:hypothetical protein